MATVSKERMIRKQVYIEPDQHRKLRELARWWGCTEAEIIRKGIDQLPEPRSPEALDALLTERLRQAGLLAPPPPYDPEYDDVPEGPQGDEWEEKEMEWLDTLPPLGLAKAVDEDREGR